MTGYDKEFESELTRAILDAILRVSTDADTIHVRTNESVGALMSNLAGMLAPSPDGRSPTTLRRAIDIIAKRLRKLAEEAIDDLQDFKARCFNGNDVEGRA